MRRRAGFLWVLTGLIGPLVLLGCADAKEINAAFAQAKVSWFVFDPDQPRGLRAMASLEQALAVEWEPRSKAVVATDARPIPEHQGAVAVSRLGLLVLDDSTGVMVAERPSALRPLTAYRTDRLFEWNGKVFITLSQEPGESASPASLAWWAPGQSRVAFYPIPSQLQNPGRQAVAFEPPEAGSTSLGFTWKVPQDSGWIFERTFLTLDDGTEVLAEGSFGLPRPEPDQQYGFLKAKLTERLGAGVPSFAARGTRDAALRFTSLGWVAVGRENGVEPRLYRLPALGTAGRYTFAVALDKGFVFSWETAFRGHVGGAGLVYVPFPILAP